MKRNPIVNRVPVHEIGLASRLDDFDDRSSTDDSRKTDELRKTSSVLSGELDQCFFVFFYSLTTLFYSIKILQNPFDCTQSTNTSFVKMSYQNELILIHAKNLRKFYHK